MTVFSMRSVGSLSFFSLVLALLATFVLVAPTAAQESDRKPNIILIMGDDHGKWATGIHGFPNDITPNIDWMARNGIQFNNAISSAPVCSPSRASLYTGKLPSQHGVHDFLAENPKFDADWLVGETLLSERLKDQNYRTALFGKWHATTDSRIPQRGFDKWLSYDAFKDGWQNQYLHQGMVHFSEDGDPTDYTGVQAEFLTEKALEFVDDIKDRPFFISLNFVEPHAPHEGLPERLVKKYRGLAVDLLPDGGSSDMNDRGDATSTPIDHDEKLAQYLASVALVDEQVGRVLKALKKRKMLDKTIIIYTSDHGYLLGQYGLYGKVNATKPANFYEETIGIPLVFYSGNRSIRPAQQRNEFVDLIDLHTTVMDYAAASGSPVSDYGPGVSVRTLLEGGRAPEWRKYHYAERANARMISNGHWKLVRYYMKDGFNPPLDKWYDLSSPIGEMHSQAAPPREELRTLMIKKLERYFATHVDPAKSGHRVWDQPAPNPRLTKDLSAFE
jgi:arylsulfatase A-like enzyme